MVIRLLNNHHHCRNTHYQQDAMCSSASGMTFPALPPRLSHLPQDIDAAATNNNCYPLLAYQRQQHPSQQQLESYTQHQPTTNTPPGILEFTTSTVSRQYTYDALLAQHQQQVSPPTSSQPQQDRTMYSNGTVQQNSFTQALTQDQSPPPISISSVESSQTSPQQQQQQSPIIPNQEGIRTPPVAQQQQQPLTTATPSHHPPTPTNNMATYYENTFTRTLTGIYLPPIPPNNYRTHEHAMYNNTRTADSSQQQQQQTPTDYIPANETNGLDSIAESYKNYPSRAPLYDAYLHAAGQDPQVSTGALNSPFYPAHNPYSLYRNTNFSGSNPDPMFTNSSSKYGGK